MPIKYKKYEKLIHNKLGEKIFVEGYAKTVNFTTIFKIRAERQKWLFEFKNFEKFYKLIKE